MIALRTEPRFERRGEYKGDRIEPEDHLFGDRCILAIFLGQLIPETGRAIVPLDKIIVVV